MTNAPVDLTQYEQSQKIKSDAMDILYANGFQPIDHFDQEVFNKQHKTVILFGGSILFNDNIISLETLKSIK